MKKPLLLISLFLFQLIVYAQQYPLFTNYVLNDFGFNPAIAGSTDYLDLRMTYRTQWIGLEDAPKTQIISAQGVLQNLPVGIGGYVFNDLAGQIKRTGVSMAFSYALNLGFGKLGLGVSGGFYSFRLSGEHEAELNTDPTLANAMTGRWTPDLSVGTYLQMHNGLFVGFSVPQVLKQEVNFNSDQNTFTTNIIPHYYAMAGYRMEVNDLLAFEPSILLKMTNAVPVQIDAALRAIFKKRFWLGGSYRTQDAATIMLGYDISQKMGLAYAYDFTISGLREGSKGSHECSLVFRLGKRDQDGDGVPDRLDECPDEPGTKENNGCPEPFASAEDNIAFKDDWDKDGIRNDIDKCPKVPGVPNNQGCPIDDRDKDGIVDAKDKCPDEHGILLTEGCPPQDIDQDGIVDAADRCPEIKGTIFNQGCPDNDSDRDGVLDFEDKCPETPGSKERGGCPVVKASEKEILDLAIRNLYFATNKYDINPEAYPYLNDLAELLVKHRDWKISLSGHADDRGDELYNFELSKSRAESVLFYLLNRGVKRRQLVVEYYGERVPTASNYSEDTRRLNRRVEMRFIWD